MVIKEEAMQQVVASFPTSYQTLVRTEQRCARHGRAPLTDDMAAGAP
jgi:hypothetical protein